MNTSTLRGIFPEPKPISRRNFVRENIKHLKEMQGLVQPPVPKITTHSQELKSKKFQHVTSKVYSNITRPVSHNLQNVKQTPPPVRPIFSSKNKTGKTSHRGVQTDRPEDVAKLYETGQLKFPTNTKTANVGCLGDGKNSSKVEVKLTKSLQKLDLGDKPNHIKQNIKNIKTKPKGEEPPDPMQPPPGYQKGTVPKYLQDQKKLKPMEYAGDSGLVLLPDDERKEYLRVARENYAGLIKELNAMPVSNDTLKKRKRKMEIEDELERLDEVIKIFQKPKVFVKADT